MVSTQRTAHKGWLLPVAVVLLLFISISVRAETPDAEELFRKLMGAFETVDFEGRLTILLNVPMSNPIHEVVIINKAPDKQLIRFIGPPEMRGTKMISVGKERWRISQDRSDRSRGRRPFMGPPPNRMMDDFLLKNIQILLRNYDVRVLDGGRIVGRDTYLLEIEPKAPSRPSRKVWMDKEKGLMLKMERYDSRGRLGGLFVFNEINLTPDIDEAIFRIRPRPEEREGPREDRVRKEVWNDEQGKPELNKIRKEVDLDIIIPGQTLGGFVLKSIEVVKLGGRSNVHLKYTDGLITLSVFQSRPDEDARGGRFGGWLRKRGEGEGKPPWREDDIKKMEIHGVECEVVSRGPTAIFRWIQNGVHLILMGELGQEELAGIVGSFISTGK